MPIERLLDLTVQSPEPVDLYKRITFPAPSPDRPYVFINMVSTVDGKTVLGEPGGSAKGLGGPTDQVLFRRLQLNADAALIGGNTLRASQVIYPNTLTRIVATRTGDLPLENRFFTDAPERAVIVAPTNLPNDTSKRLRSAARLILTGERDVDWTAALRVVRQELNIHALLCEGGSLMNGQLINSGLADELFLTLTPKLKGGTHLPTIVGGDGFPPGVAQPLELMSVYRDGGEIYLRYRLTPRHAP